MQIFFSYSAQDFTLVNEVAARLPSGVRAWIDMRELVAGNALRQSIRHAIDQSGFFVIFLSTTALESSWVLEELRWAEDRQKELDRTFIVAIVLDESSRKAARSITSNRLFVSLIDQSPPSITAAAASLENAIIEFMDKALASKRVETVETEQGEKLRVLRMRGDISENHWRAMFKSATTRVWLLGHAMGAALEKSRRVIADRIAAGVDVRLVLLDPDDAANQQIREVMTAMPRLDLHRKIRMTLSEARDLYRNDALLSIGVTQATMHNSIVIIDDRFLITLYSHDVETGNVGLTLDLNMSSAAEICAAFEREFLWHWAHAAPANDSHSFQNISLRVLEHEKTARKSFEWYAGKGQPLDLPPPHLAVIFPSYRCQYGPRTAGDTESTERFSAPYSKALLCGNCMYGQKLNRPKLGVLDIDVAKFERVCRELVDIGTNVLEISGGGEPLHHPAITDIVNVIQRARAYAPDRAYGLISNAYALTEGQQRIAPERLFAAFSYIRWSWPEDAELEPTRRVLIAGLERLLAAHRKWSGSPVRIGVKVLITPSNSRVPKVVAALIEELFEAGVDHVKVRTLRTSDRSTDADPNSIRNIADALAFLHSILFERRVFEAGKTLEIDVAPRYVSNYHQCRLSTLMTVIEPSGNVRMCWNDLAQNENRVIGNAFETSFRELWGTEHHRHVCATMEAKSVCNSPDGCHCRIVGYQEVVDRMFSGYTEPLHDAENRVPSDKFL